jgi:Transglutaminase-like superfamily
MNADPIGAALEEWTSGREARAARISLFEHVRDMPYEYSAVIRDPLEVLTRGRGCCSDKHGLLGDLFRRQGLPVRHMICTHRFNESPLPFPDEMQGLLERNEIVDLHDYLQVCVDGEWIDIDATWERALRDYGFPVNDEWDGRSSMVLTVTPDEQVEVEGDPQKAKEEMLSKLTPRQRMLRKQFLEALGRWVQDLSGETGREG